MCVIKILKILSVFGSEKRSNGLSGVRRTQIKDQARLGVQAESESDGVHFSVRSTALELDGRFQWAVKVINLIRSHTLSLSPCTHHLHNFHISSCSRAPAQKYLTDARCCDRRVSFRSAKLDEASVFSST